MDLPNRDNSATKKVVVDNNSKIRIYLDKMVARKLSTLFPVFAQGVHPDSIHLYLDSRRPIYYEHEHGWITFFIEVNPEDLKKNYKQVIILALQNTKIKLKYKCLT